MSDSNNRSGGIGFVGALTLAFIVLKLCHVINWTWPIVLLPIILSTGLTLVILLVIVLVAAVRS